MVCMEGVCGVCRQALGSQICVYGDRIGRVYIGRQCCVPSVVSIIAIHTKPIPRTHQPLLARRGASANGSERFRLHDCAGSL